MLLCYISGSYEADIDSRSLYPYIVRHDTEAGAILMKTAAARAYTSLQADERQEFRLPKSLKAHLHEAATLQGETVAEYVIEAVAERVSKDLAEATTWELTVPEQKRLLEILIESPESTQAFVESMRRADALFGPISAQH